MLIPLVVVLAAVVVVAMARRGPERGLVVATAVTASVSSVALFLAGAFWVAAQEEPLSGSPTQDQLDAQRADRRRAGVAAAVTAVAAVTALGLMTETRIRLASYRRGQ